MIDRTQVESILKINGLTPSAPDEEIRSILLSARYDKDEVDTAIMVLRENQKTKETRVDGLHKVFRSNDGLQPQEISKLLGIEVDVTEPVEAHANRRDLSRWQFLAVWLASVGVAAVGILVYMYFNQLGPFHPSVDLMFL